MYQQNESGEYESIDTVPTSGYKLNADNSYCEVDDTKDNNIQIEYRNGQINFLGMTQKGTKCYVYFDISNSAADIIEDLYEDNQDILVYDGTEDNNLRYIGENPANYVYFNCNDYSNPTSDTCELWRIIGVFNENTHGISGQKLIKLIGSDISPAANVVWDTDDSNNWSSASLQERLNGDYLNRTGSHSSDGITDATRDMIETVTWKLGGLSSTSSNTASAFYTAERGVTEWNGKIGLIYPSDLGFATSGGSTGRDTCLSYNLRDWDNYSNCYNYDWLSEETWTITPMSSSTSTVFYVTSSGYLGSSRADAYSGRAACPSLYLSSDVTITGGSGTESNPYTLAS